MKLQLKTIVAAAALIAAAGQASAAIQLPTNIAAGGSELVFFAWDDVKNISYEKDLGIVFNTFLPASTATAASNFTQSVAGAAWDAYVTNLGASGLSNTKWGVVGVYKGSAGNNGQQYATTLGFGGTTDGQLSGALKNAVSIFNTNVLAVNNGDVNYAANGSTFSNSTGQDNWAVGIQHNSGGKFGFNIDNSIGTDSTFNLLSAQSAAGTASINTAYTGMMKFDGSNVSYVVAVPEPSTYAMMIAGLLLVGGIAARRRNS